MCITGALYTHEAGLSCDVQLQCIARGDNVHLPMGESSTRGGEMAYRGASPWGRE
jgi:hypothetical protein